MQDAKEEVRARLDIEDVVGEYVQLRRAGRNYKGLSPFTQERTPSFVVSPDKNIWHDFSSGRGGDVFNFVMEVEGVEFREALEILARRAGVDLSKYRNGADGQLAKKKKRSLEAHKLAANFYQHHLVKTPHALEYARERGLNKHIIGEFMIGYAPDGGLADSLVKRGFAREELREAGLLNQYGGDLFRNRLVVPLMDGAGQVIGFTGRTIGDDTGGPKYLNTPETALYNKTRHVFGLSQAKAAIRKEDFTVIVEGNLDVVASHQVGVANVVATAGTALTEAQLRALARLSPQVRLAFDADKAGVAAAERSIPLAQNVNVQLSMITLPDGVKDPDELIQKDPKLWRNALDNHMPVVDWLLAQYASREDLSTAAGKHAYTNAGLQAVHKLQDPVDREHYMQIMAEATSSTLGAIQAKLKNVDNATSEQGLKPVRVASKPVHADYVQQDVLLALACVDGDVRQMLSDVELGLDGEQRMHVLEFLRQTDEDMHVPPKELHAYEEYAKMLVLRAEELYAGWQSRDRREQAAAILRKLTKEHKKAKIEQLVSELREAEGRFEDERAEKLRAEINALIKGV